MSNSIVRHGLCAWCLVLGIAILSSSSVASANLLSNGGFESGTGVDADSWSEFQIAAGSSVAISQRVNTAPNTGSYHLNLAVMGAADGGPSAEAQQLTPTGSIVGGNSYDFSILARQGSMPIGPGVVVELRIQWLDSDGSHGGGVKGATGILNLGGSLTANYQSFGFTNAIAAADSDAALVSLRVAGGAFAGSDGSVYFDDANMTPEPASLALLAIGGILMMKRRGR